MLYEYLNTDEIMTVITRLLVALLAGSLIGVERAYHGRPAGLRTHALVCLASSLLMLLTAFQWELLKDVPLETIRVDPTRMAQGLMTGIGFLGAGVIMKEQFSIRGLTTAASVWMTSSIGILIGMGFYFPGLFATFLTLMILSVFGWVERRVPTRRFAKLVVRIRSREVMTSEALRDIIEEFDIKGANPSYLLVDEGRFLEYQLTIFSHYTKNFQRLAESLSAMETITEFSIIPTGD